jgi:PAS domain S-box-containing protein
MDPVRDARGAVTDFELVELNEPGEALLGQPRAKLEGRRLTAIVPRAAEAGFLARCLGVLETGEPYVGEVRVRDSAVDARWVLQQVVRVDDGLALTVRDISDRKAVEESLRASEERYRLLVETATDAIYRIDPRGIFTYANPVAGRVLGVGEGGLVGRSYLDFVRPDHRAEGTALYSRQIATRVPVTYWEFPALRADGREVWVGQNVQIEERDGLVTGLSAVARDITDRRRLEEDLRHVQKMEAVGQLAGGVAHDFNNLLTAIRGYSDVLLQSLAADDARRADVLEISNATDRAAVLTRQLLTFSRRQVMQLESLSLNTVVSDLARTLDRMLGPTITVQTTLDQDLAIVRADPGQMEQVLLNLALNARDAMAPAGGTLRIETATVEVAAAPDVRHAPGRYAVLRVSDTGSGMTSEVRDRMFEPFFTTKARGRGTGLGLAMVYGIVTQCGGFITVDSSPGKGAVLALHLPAAAAVRVEPALPAVARVRPAGKGQGTILVAEDSEGVLTLTERVLREQGYTVLTAHDGVEALDVSRAHPGDIDLLLTDVMMPRMNGGELARAFAAERPGAVVAIMSGYMDEDSLRRTLDNRDTPVLQKPFAASTLVSRVHEILFSQSAA